MNQVELRKVYDVLLVGCPIDSKYPAQSKKNCIERISVLQYAEMKSDWRKNTLLRYNGVTEPTVGEMIYVYMMNWLSFVVDVGGSKAEAILLWNLYHEEFHNVIVNHGSSDIWAKKYGGYYFSLIEALV